MSGEAQAPAIDGLVAMLRSDTSAEVSAASEALAQLLSEKDIRAKVCRPDVCQLLLRFVSGVVAKAIAPSGDPAASASALDAEESAALAVRWWTAPESPPEGETEPAEPRLLLSPDAVRHLGFGLLCTSDGASSLLVPDGVARANTASVVESVRASEDAMREGAAGGAEAGQAFAREGDDAHVTLLDALALKRAITLMVNVTASKEGLQALVAGACAGREEGCLVALPLVASATMAFSTQLSALRVLSNVSSGIKMCELERGDGTAAAAVPKEEAEEEEAATDPAPDPEDGTTSPVTGALAMLLPIVQCGAGVRGFVGVCRAECLVRLTGIVASLMAGRLGMLSREPTPLLLQAGDLAMESGAVRVMAGVLTECADRQSKVRQMLAQAGPEATLTGPSQNAVAAAQEAAKGASMVLEAIIRVMPEAKAAVEAEVRHMQAIASQRQEREQAVAHA